MENSLKSENQQPQTIRERKAELEAALEEEDRMSQRQILFKKLWKLNQQRPESPKQPALTEQKA